jgi:hypothetical protein
MSAIEVQIRATQGGRGDFQDGVGGFLEGRDGAVFDFDLFLCCIVRLGSPVDEVGVEGGKGDVRGRAP